jgi:hypothetical protein
VFVIESSLERCSQLERNERVRFSSSFLLLWCRERAWFRVAVGDDLGVERVDGSFRTYFCGFGDACSIDCSNLAIVIYHVIGKQGNSDNGKVSYHFLR